MGAEYEISNSTDSGYSAEQLDGDLNDYISQMAFWSNKFDFTANTLTDKSGNGNDVPINKGNCLNFINFNFSNIIR